LNGARNFDGKKLNRGISLIAKKERSIKLKAKAIENPFEFVSMTDRSEKSEKIVLIFSLRLVLKIDFSLDRMFLFAISE
jgi:hypothetical protein